MAAAAGKPFGVMDGHRPSKRRRTANPIETANNKPNVEFVAEYMRPRPGWTDWTHPSTGAKYTLSLVQAGELTPEELDECFRLIDDTSGDNYRASSIGWHPAAKRKEMRSPDLRYVLVKTAVDEQGPAAIEGFASMMPTFENHEPVVYCYEIHLRPALQRTGLGKDLMGYIMAVADNVPSVEKTMLTCFVSNGRALDFYRGMGFATDDYSPGERKLRGGKVVVPDYVILSRATARARGRHEKATT
ncbi:hypothetical protein S40285_03219 [Stachybotrys chlorohalonatus IBT 40285]|uniref:N-alpha-acetyltransferase 40 n=1 Tax=Stachybotrys chlorohalonatus (strain IBT 40285) TaxID=1283841 RepID=A0A084QNJ5_STAC4|nr:hypothetical protein S40285_03219 [Stachybotrys chlorohalonata IBT 40285]